VLTARKAAHLMRDATRLKRGGDATTVSLGADEAVVEDILSREPTPEFAVQAAEEYQRLLGLLGDAELERVAVWKMEGHSNEEIAEKLGCVPRTVERKLRLIRDIWQRETPT
jgi:DNA-directed RNA polymerase specialized sigma24 family protein